MKAKYLPNAVQIHAKVMSGGLPEGSAAFRELADLGVKTIISVDGAKPDVETAAEFGLRYVHLPHGYDGIPAQRVKELAKAVRDLDGAVYIHCHHGKHRSPAAASVACVAASLILPADALSVLALAGTSQDYRGLFQAADNAQPLDEALLDGLNVEFRETVEVPPIAEAMVVLERTHEHVTKLAKAGWHALDSHPDLEPVHEALLLQECFTELLRTEEVQQQPEDFQQLLRDSESDARMLKDELRAWNARGTEVNPPELLARLTRHISANCGACHQKYRDGPLEEKQ